MKLSRGFTLIELLVVIAVMGVLATIVLVAVNPTAQFAKIRDAQRKSDLRILHQALEEYYVFHGRYPPASNAVRTCNYNQNCYVYSTDSDSTWIDALEPYLKQFPVDPLNNGCCPWTVDGTRYNYSYGNVYQDGKIYDLNAKFEHPDDPHRCGLNDYRLSSGGRWCQEFGGRYSNQLYDVEP